MGWLVILGIVMVLVLIGGLADLLHTKFKLHTGVTWCVAILLAMGGCHIYFSMWQKGRDNREALLDPFRPHLGTYNSATGVSNTSTAEPCIRGRIIVLDVLERTNALSHFTFELPEYLRPTSPNDVKMVLLLKRDNKMVGRYTNTRNAAYQRCCDATLVDLTIPAIIAKESFAGSYPGGGDLYGSKPDGQVIKWISKLPWR